MENIRNLFAHSFGGTKCDVDRLQAKNNKLKRKNVDDKHDFQETLDAMSSYGTKIPSSRVRSVSECSTNSVDESSPPNNGSFMALAQSPQVAGNKMESEAYFWIMWRS